MYIINVFEYFSWKLLFIFLICVSMVCDDGTGLLLFIRKGGRDNPRAAT